MLYTSPLTEKIASSMRVALNCIFTLTIWWLSVSVKRLKTILWHFQTYKTTDTSKMKGTILTFKYLRKGFQTNDSPVKQHGIRYFLFLLVLTRSSVLACRSSVDEDRVPIYSHHVSPIYFRNSCDQNRDFIKKIWM